MLFAAIILVEVVILHWPREFVLAIPVNWFLTTASYLVLVLVVVWDGIPQGPPRLAKPWSRAATQPYSASTWTSSRSKAAFG